MLTTLLRFFMSVARLGSIRAASTALNVAQSAVSRRVQALEHHVGCVLLDRLPNGVTLTEAGRALFEHGLRLEFEVAGLQSDLAALRGLLTGHVRIAAIESMVPNVLPRAMTRFRALHPGVTFGAEVVASERVVGLIQDGAADIGIGLSARPGAEFRILSSSPEPLVAVASPTHPLAARARLELADLAGCALALAPLPSVSRQIFDEACRVAGVRIKAAVETYSVELMQQLAICGEAVTLLLRHAIAGQIRRGELKQLGLERQLFGGTIDVFAHASRTLPAAVDKFVAILMEEIAVDGR